MSRIEEAEAGGQEDAGGPVGEQRRAASKPSRSTSTASDSAPARAAAPATGACRTARPRPSVGAAPGSARAIDSARRMPTPSCVEQYRKLAAMLHQSQVERGVKVVMLASAHDRPRARR